MPGSIARTVARCSLLAEDEQENAVIDDGNPQASNEAVDDSTANTASRDHSQHRHHRTNRSAGNDNPEKNDSAATVTVSHGQHVDAAGSATQAGTGNIAVSITKTGPVPAGMTFSADGGYSGISAPHGDTCLDTWSPAGCGTGYREGHSPARGIQEHPDNARKLSF